VKKKAGKPETRKMRTGKRNIKEKKTGILRSGEIQISDKSYVCIHFNK
jgi:hypothetical protein